MKKSTPFRSESKPESKSAPLGLFETNETAHVEAEEAEAFEFSEDDAEGLAEQYDEAAESDALELPQDGAPDDAGASDHADAATTRVPTVGSAAITLAYAAGFTMVVAGLVLAAVFSTNAGSSDVRTFFERTGLAPVDFLLIGLVLAGLAGIWRRLRGHEAQLAAATSAVARDSDRLQEQLDYLIEVQGTSRPADGSAAPSHALQHAVHLIERQDEKINNLSKATKMYGKPLLEITNQMAESSRTLSELGSRIDAVKVILEQSSSRLETALTTEVRKVRGPDTADLKEAIGATRDTVRALEVLQRDLSQRITDKTDKLSTELIAVTRDSAKELTALKKDIATHFTETTGKIAGDMAALDRRVESARETMATGLKKVSTQSEQMAAQMGQLTTKAEQTTAQMGQLAAKTDQATAQMGQLASKTSDRPADAGVTPELVEALEGIQQQIGDLHRGLAHIAATASRSASTSAAPATSSGSAAPESNDGAKAMAAPSAAPAGQKPPDKGVQSAIAKLKRLRQ